MSNDKNDRRSTREIIFIIIKYVYPEEKTKSCGEIHHYDWWNYIKFKRGIKNCSAVHFS